MVDGDGAGAKPEVEEVREERQRLAAGRRGDGDEHEEVGGGDDVVS
jgi:hypothetical protein